MICERVKFYADTPLKEKNKYFCWNWTIFNYESNLYNWWLKGFNIRAAYYESYDNETGEVFQNLKINIQQIISKQPAK